MAIYNSACNNASCLINEVDVAVEGDGSEVTFTLTDPCNKLTHAGLVRNVLNAAITAYIALEEITFARDCHSGSTCCCGYPMTFTLGTKSATVDFGDAHTYVDVTELTVTAPFEACNS